jgi:hypothetical protein
MTPRGPVTITEWPDVRAAHGLRKQAAWEELTRRASHPQHVLRERLERDGNKWKKPPRLAGWSPGTFKGDHRAKGDVEVMHGIGFDYDSGRTSIDDAHIFFSKYCGFLHTTLNHTLHCARFRVMLLLSRGVTGDEYRTIWSVVAVHAREAGHILDEQPKDPCRFWFVPIVIHESAADYASHTLDGEPVDVEKVLAEAAAVEAARKSKRADDATNRREKRKAAPPWRWRHYVERALKDEVGRVARAQEGDRNSQLNRSAFSLGQLVGAGVLDEREVEAELHQVALLAGLDESEIGPTIRSGLGSGMREPRDLPEANNGSRADGDCGGDGDCGSAGSGSDLPERAVVVVDADEGRVNDEVLAALGKISTVYSRGGRLVRVVNAPPPGSLTGDSIFQIQELPQPSLREMITRATTLVRATSRGLENAHPPEWCTAAIGARAHYPGLRELAGVVTSPTMRPDGTILDKAGYDPATRLILHPVEPIDPIAEAPTREDAISASDALLDVVCDFPFARPEHRSAWLAALLTLVARHAIDGDVPLVYIDANTRGSGKGLVIDCASLIATGRVLPRSSPPQSDEEMRKVITAAARAGVPAVLLDNAKGRLEHKSLESVLTCMGLWADRILGRSEQGTWPMRTVWCVTGNNVVLGSDTVRRSLHIRLESPEEHPEDRGNFKQPDLLDHVRRERPRLASAALTILRAYYIAGRPEATLTPWGSYTAWTRLMRQVVVWLEMPDPAAGRKELRERADVDREAIITFMAGVERLAGRGGGVSVVELLAGADKDPELRATLVELAPPQPGETMPTTRAVGAVLRSLRGRIVAGGKLDHREGHARERRWYVDRIDSHHDHHSHQSSGAGGDDGDDGDSGSGDGGVER